MRRSSVPGTPRPAAAPRGCRTFDLLRCAFPGARLRASLDGGFASPALLNVLDAEPGVEDVVAMAGNAVVPRAVVPLMTTPRLLADETGETGHVYGETGYQAGTWDRPRRVLIKAEVVHLAGREPRDHPRFDITNLRRRTGSSMKRSTAAGATSRTGSGNSTTRPGSSASCWRFWATQLRVLLTAAAYVVVQELWLRAHETAFVRAQVGTLRDALLKLGTHVVRSVHRLVLHFAQRVPAPRLAADRPPPRRRHRLITVTLAPRVSSPRGTRLCLVSAPAR